MPPFRIWIRKTLAFCCFALAALLAACSSENDAALTVSVAAACASTQAQAVQPAPAPVPSPGNITLIRQEISLALTSPVFMTAPPGDTTRLFVAEKGGVIRIIDIGTQPAQLLPTPFLTIQVNAAGEGGLLGLAFHPDYANNGFFYVNVINLSGDTEIRRYRVLGSPASSNLADAASSTPVITISQLGPGATRFTNHKAGWLGFGQDGYLYAALGDGGGGGDPFASGQNLGTLLGKMLRLNVDVDDFAADAARNYGIPPDNPCVGQAGALGEIWSMGLRNPWRPSFDRVSGDLYIADVGQGLREEVNVAATLGGAGRGTNYGWNIMEGTLCFSPASGCNTTGLQLPVVEYPHSGPDSGCSITGGYVYRGTAIAGLQGTYFYADFCQGFVRSFRFGNGQVTDHFTWASLGGGNITSFGEDAAGELYIVTLGGGLFRIVQ
jgi:glucose/arabinose dehydrogenase